MKKLLITAALALTASLHATAQTCQSEEWAFRVKDEAFARSSIDSLSEFMTDLLGSRLAASQQKLRAEGLVIDRLKAIGLENVHAEYGRAFERGGWDNEMTYAAMTAPYYCSFAVNPKAWTGSTNGLVKGECIAIDAITADDLAKYRGQLAGKIVLAPVQQTYEMKFEPLARRYSDEELAEFLQDNRPQQRGGRPRPANWAQMRELNAALEKMVKEEGALALIVGSGTFNVPSSTGVNYKQGDPEPLAELVLPIEDHSRMVRLVKRGQKVEMELNVRNTFTANDHVNNVIAEIPGTDSKLKSEVILLGSHLDSWHGGTGGADNASGCIVMIEAMRILKSLGIQPKRTIRLALWGGEELGLYGSRGYADQYLYDAEQQKRLPGYDKFALYLNQDYGSGRFRGIFLEENDMALPFFRTWMQPIESLGFTTLSIHKAGGTDHMSFSGIGLPAFQFISDPLEYGRTYHTPMDTYERLSLSDLKVNACLVAWFALNAAMDPARIPAKPEK